MLQIAQRSLNKCFGFVASRLALRFGGSGSIREILISIGQDQATGCKIMVHRDWFLSSCFFFILCILFLIFVFPFYSIFLFIYIFLPFSVSLIFFCFHHTMSYIFFFLFSFTLIILIFSQLQFLLFMIFLSFLHSLLFVFLFPFLSIPLFLLFSHLCDVYLFSISLIFFFSSYSVTYIFLPFFIHLPRPRLHSYTRFILLPTPVFSFFRYPIIFTFT